MTKVTEGEGRGPIASPEDRQRVASHYESQLQAHGPTARGMDWKDTETQYLRFELLTEGLDLAGATLHEIGSGAGHFLDFLRNRNIAAQYSGSDLSMQMVAAARRLHPGVQFDQRDVLHDSAVGRFDYVICSGVFNVSLGCPEAEWQAFIEAAVRRMFEMCDVAIAFNVMTNQVDFRAEGLHYTDPDAMVEFCKEAFGPNVTIRRDGRLYEYTVQVHRSEIP